MKKFIFTSLLLLIAMIVVAQRPVTPDASPEAKALLAFLYDVKGKVVLDEYQCSGDF